MPAYNEKKWLGYEGDATVADELAFDALPEETRRMVARVIHSRLDDESSDIYQSGYDAGVEHGRGRGKELARDEFEKETERMRQALEKIANKSISLGDAARVAKAALAA